jgi:hypothetical protein
MLVKLEQEGKGPQGGQCPQTPIEVDNKNIFGNFN